MLQALRRASTTAGPFTGLESWPQPAIESFSQYLGTDVRDLDGPAVILDLNVLRRNCALMLETTDVLQVGWRAHVKTHKTIELTKLQVGEAPRPVKLIVSTVNEALFLLPWLVECKKQGRTVNVIYGVPPSSTCFKRLSPLREQLGQDSISFLLDHPAQLRNLIGTSSTTEPVPVWIKVDPGYHRAGAAPKSTELEILLNTIKQHASSSKGHSQPLVKLVGFYTHMGHSYGAKSSSDALDFLAEEIQQVLDATEGTSPQDFGVQKFTISVGATPTAASAANLVSDPNASTKVKEVMAKVASTHELELHAGVYPTLDMQQMSTHARANMTTSDIGIRILAEVLSVYENRETPEALIGAGSLALGREPCQSYPGWGVLAPNPWKPQEAKIIYDEEEKTGWMVKRISQEHGILSWEGPREKKYPLIIGEKVLVWPNHACIAGPNFNAYYVVDSSRGEGKEMEIVDAWVRARGW